MELTLKRIDYTRDRTLGSLWDGHKPIALTLEDGWKSNHPNISCIPKGLYKCSRFSGSKFHNTWQVDDVQFRNYILFHIGNTELDTEGCILLGSEFGVLHGKDAILESSDAFMKFMNHTASQNFFTLRIEGDY